MSAGTIHLIDRDTARRQAIARTIFGMGRHAEPYEAIDEFAACLPSQGVVLVEADHGQVARSIVLLDERDVRLHVIGFSTAPEASAIVQAVLLGASGYLVWPFGRAEIEEALAIVRETAAHRPGQEGQAGEYSGVAQARSLIASLSAREGEVLDGMIEGLSSRDIGEHLQISHRTVEVHRQNLMRKLRARRIADVVRIAVEAKLQGGPFSRGPVFRGFDSLSLAATDQAA